MNIGIIGAGNVGATAARLFVKAGHAVAISNSRGPESLRQLVSEIGSGARAMTVDEAASFGEIVLLAIPWRNPQGLPKPDMVRDKIVIDATNPYTKDGEVVDLNGSTSSEEILKQISGARLVKAFNTIYYRRLATDGKTNAPIEERPAIFVAGDDEGAKAIVMKLIEQIGFAPVDNGSLREGGRRQQPGSPTYNRPLTGRQAKSEMARAVA
jgi:8-hydroxy-5-deazaflavin:NADPH oxidoreductase